MKIRLDTEKKTVSVENNTKLLDLIETLEKLFPDSGWKDFVLENFKEESTGYQSIHLPNSVKTPPDSTATPSPYYPPQTWYTDYSVKTQ